MYILFPIGLKRFPLKGLLNTPEVSVDSSLHINIPLINTTACIYISRFYIKEKLVIAGLVLNFLS